MQTGAGASPLAGLVAADGLQGKPTIKPLDVIRAPSVQKSEAEGWERVFIDSSYRVTINFGSVKVLQHLE